MPVLIRRADGQPLYFPTLYTVTQLRATHRATATIEQALRSVMLLYIVLEKDGVNVDERLRKGEILTIAEVDQLAKYCEMKLAAIEAEVQGNNWTTTVSRQFSAGKGGKSKADPWVRPPTKEIRIHYIRAYIEWRIQHAILRLSAPSRDTVALKAAANVLVEALRSRSRPSRKGKGERQSLNVAQRALLTQKTDSSACDSPWLRKRSRRRNELIVRWFSELGIRRGELLGVQVTDINFRSNEVFIAKRPQNPDDPRIRQPNTKTRPRLLALSEELVSETRRYIKEVRRMFPGAARHDFLFVATGSGRPLSLEGLNKIFSVLQQRVPEFRGILSPHVLRHTWNDMFSETMDEAKVPPEKEEKWRSRLMGWTETSGTASVYTKRHVQRQAAEASLAMQARFVRSNTPSQSIEKDRQPAAAHV